VYRHTILYSVEVKKVTEDDNELIQKDIIINSIGIDNKMLFMECVLQKIKSKFQFWCYHFAKHIIIILVLAHSYINFLKAFNDDWNFWEMGEKYFMAEKL
jgi:hypothetical protein